MSQPANGESSPEAEEEPAASEHGADACAEGPPGSPSWAPGYRHVTADLAPIPFRFRATPEDFVVEELPLYPAAGEGTHLYLTIEKRGMGTVEAVRTLARALERDERDFGFAGRKDAKAVTRQRISIEHIEPERVHALDLPNLHVLEVERHGNKLRVGHLAGNRFELALRDVPDEDFSRLEAGLEHVARVGLPNYYGAQRFGRKGTTWKLGRLLLAGELDAYVRALVTAEHGEHSRGRAELEEVLTSGTPSARRRLSKLAPSLTSEQAALARQVARRPNQIGGAARAIPLRTRLFHVSALQARIFNRVLSARMGEPGGVMPLAGDVVTIHGQPGLRRIEAGELDDVRSGAARLELGATGPLPGTKIPETEGRPGEIETQALAAEGLEVGDFAAGRRAGGRGMDVRGARRALYVPVRELSVEREGDGVVHLRFTLPPGSFATSLLEELRKNYGQPAIDA